MPRFAWFRWLSALVLTVFAGCADNALLLQNRVASYEQQQKNLIAQNQHLQDRAAALDRDNQELGVLLAQTRQQTKLAQDQLAAMQEQLRTVTTRLTEAQAEKQKALAQTASMQRQTGVAIAPNNSFLQSLPVIRQPGVHVRRDGDVVRIELPGNRLFESGGARLLPGAVNLIAEVANELRRTYPDQIIAVEGHTDTDPVMGGQWQNNHQLSVARAMAVYDVLVSSVRFRPEQLFVTGHGPNHPVVSNATFEGKQRNRRVELVVYPERRATGG